LRAQLLRSVLGPALAGLCLIGADTAAAQNIRMPQVSDNEPVLLTADRVDYRTNGGAKPDPAAFKCSDQETRSASWRHREVSLFYDFH
jgi:hypothetical protein